MKNWLSAQLYYDDDLDIVLKRIVIPFILEINAKEQDLLEYFFIRYGEGGAHIRLRVWTSKDLVQWKKKLKKAVDVFNNASGPESILPINLDFQSYIPEIDRYGNSETIHLAERQFKSSSDLVLTWLGEGYLDTVSQRYIAAIKMHLAFFYSIRLPLKSALDISQLFINEWIPSLYNTTQNFPAQNQEFLRQFEESFRKYQPQLTMAIMEYWQTLQSGKLPRSLLNFNGVNNAVFNSYLSYMAPGPGLNAILTSFMHMTNNRLGITNRDEAFILFLVLKCLKEIDGKKQRKAPAH